MSRKTSNIGGVREGERQYVRENKQHLFYDDWGSEIGPRMWQKGFILSHKNCN